MHSAHASLAYFWFSKFNGFVSHNRIKLQLSCVYLINLPLHFPNINDQMDTVMWKSIIYAELVKAIGQKSIDFNM